MVIRLIDRDSDSRRAKWSKFEEKINKPLVQYQRNMNRMNGKNMHGL